MIKLGISQRKFRTHYFEKMLYLRKNACERILDWQDIDEMLFVIDPDATRVRLYENGQLGQRALVEEYSEGGKVKRRVKREMLYESLRNGASLVVNGVDAVNLRIHDICMELGRFAGCRTVANGYVAFGGEGTFGNHWDTHDVFVLQVIGRKRWKVYVPSVQLPLQHQKSMHHKDACPSEPYFDDYLEAGDVLYLPRGWWHNAIPSDGETFHLAVGLHGPTVVDYVMWACGEYLPSHVSFRAGFPFEVTAGLPDEWIRTIAAVVSDPAHIREFANTIHSNARVSSRFSIGPVVAGREELQDDACIRLNSWRLQYVNETLVINGKGRDLSDIESEVVKLLDEVTSVHVDEAYARLGRFAREDVLAAVRRLRLEDIVEIYSGCVCDAQSHA